MDLIIKNGYVIDGTGRKGYFSDIAIDKGRILGIGDYKDKNADQVIDAKGLVVTPGFIDIHSHSDWRIFSTLQCENVIRQGITTEIVGHCGDSAYPVTNNKAQEIYDYFKTQKMDKALIDWKSTKEFWSRVEEVGISHNIAFLVGHGTVRLNVMGYDNRKPTYDELKKMKILIEEAMEAGALGMSSGLPYPPGMYADTKEIVELCNVVKKYNGVYCTHLRNQGNRLIEAVKEAIEIGKSARVPVNISHLKASDKENWGKVYEAVKIIDEAREQGLNIICDVYPYVAASNPLSAELPGWICEGGMDELTNKLKDKSVLNKLKYEMPKADDEIWNLTYICDLERKEEREYIGKSIKNISKFENIHPVDLICKLLIDNRNNIQVNVICMNEEDVKYVLSYKYSSIGADGGVFITDGYSGHPRAFGTFPAFIGRYIREEKLVSIEEGIRKITSMPAEFMGINDRGIIEEGRYADLVIFDFDKIIDKATYKYPALYPEGIEYVIVNGVIQVERSRFMKLPIGKIISRNK